MRRQASVIPLLTVEARLKRSLRRHLRGLGFKRTEQGGLTPPDRSKDSFRQVHRAQLCERLKAERSFIALQWPLLQEHFANGNEVDPSRIAPRLELIQADTWQSDLFRLAALTWSVPVSQGYGRRMRFLIWDDSNDKLLGLLALADPVFNLAVRDRFIGWTADDRHISLTPTCWVLSPLTTCFWAASWSPRLSGRVRSVTLLPGNTPGCEGSSRVRSSPPRW